MTPKAVISKVNLQIQAHGLETWHQSLVQTGFYKLVAIWLTALHIIPIAMDQSRSM